MSNSCIVQDYGDEGFDPYFINTVRARKNHDCCECGDAIDVGDLHEHVRGKYDDCWDSYRTCARCLNIHADYFAGGRCLGAMVDDFEAEHGFDYRDGIPADFAPCSEGTG